MEKRERGSEGGTRRFKQLSNRELRRGRQYHYVKMAGGGRQVAIISVFLPFSQFLLVNDSREDRRAWMEQLQKQNPKLLDTHEPAAATASGNTLQVNSVYSVIVQDL